MTARAVPASLHIDTSLWPIVVHTTIGSPTDEQFDAYIREATELLLRGEPHVDVMDSSRLGRASAYARARKKEWLAKYEREFRQTCLGTAFVLSSPLARFAAATIMLVSPLPVPYTVCATVEEGMAWARQILSGASLSR